MKKEPSKKEGLRCYSDSTTKLLEYKKELYEACDNLEKETLLREKLNKKSAPRIKEARRNC